ncbi:MAG: efflux RND transporter periplasmic adaptor subunit [Desulfobacterium sp.]|nr:efflux RND transporter periplasmic adaptor subunit [Desulfobacterium sp.]MBU3949369.1 efflux RND transporter periplasmic adaptor subunit [Pseudomonadota bacterium]MBU4035084.1 efflux RND transporter periplasmic adaptor subunit [Pseudomonadota bacterium]
MSVFNLSKKQIYRVLAVLAVFCSILAVFFYKDRFKETALIEDDTPLVRTMIVDNTDSIKHYSYSGEVRGRRESQLAFQVGGKIIKRHVELGSIVKQGQILMEIDPQDIIETVNSHIAQVASAKSQLQLATNNLNRYRQLYEQDVISRAQLDRYQSAYEVAQAGHQQANAQYVQVSNQLKYSSLHTDRSGVISGISAEVGQVVGSGQIVVTLVEDKELEIEIYVPENRIGELKNASQIKIVFWALPDLKVSGKIREIAPIADTISRTYKVRVSLLNQLPEIKPGMTATAEISVPDDQAVIASIPLSALYQTDETPGVWIVKDGKVRFKTIKTGSFGNNRVQVIAGLKTGEVIVTAGVHKLREGQKVKVMEGDKT